MMAKNFAESSLLLLAVSIEVTAEKLDSCTLSRTMRLC